MKHASLFSGIGGFDAAAEWMGWENVFHCEINPFGQQVLKYYWPNSTLYEDITKTDFSVWRGKIDILTGGFPCQPYSAAGKRLGTEDDRHLWPEMLRAIREIQPTWVVGENVRGLTNWNGGLVFNEVQVDLEAEGYEVQSFLLPAAGVGAPHERYRIWFVAYSDNARTEQQLRDNGNRTKENQGWEEQSFNKFRENGGNAADTDSGRLERSTEIGRNCEYVKRESGFGATSDTSCKGCEGMQFRRSCKGIEWEQNETHGTASELCEIQNVSDTDATREWRHEWKSKSEGNIWEQFPTQSPICSRNDGLSSRLVGITFPKHRNESIKSYGNSVIPQVVYQIFKAIEQYDLLNNHHSNNPDRDLRDIQGN
jgi:DNA (cytosine-5)-methyltransferase 1